MFYTKKDKTLYALIREWPKDNKLKLQFPVATDQTKARMLGMPTTLNLNWEKVSDDSEGPSTNVQRGDRNLNAEGKGAGLELDLPPLNPGTMPCQDAWVVALTGIGNI